MCSLKSHSVTFSRVTGSPRFKERKHPSFNTYLNEHVSTLHHKKSLKDGIHIIVIIFGKHTPPYPKIPICDNKDRQNSHIWKKNKSETNGPMPYTMSEARKSKIHPPEYRQSHSHWLRPTTVLPEMGLGNRSLYLTALFLLAVFLKLCKNTIKRINHHGIFRIQASLESPKT